jgi:hypothetical protein
MFRVLRELTVEQRLLLGFGLPTVVFFLSATFDLNRQGLRLVPISAQLELTSPLSAQLKHTLSSI